MSKMWPDELLTGIRIVDLQHKQLANFAEQLRQELIKPDPNSQAVSELLFGLIDSTYNHFLTEEELFQRVLYPEAAAHIADHNFFTRKISALLELHEKGEKIPIQSPEFLDRWLVNHVRYMDKLFVPFLLSKWSLWNVE